MIPDPTEVTITIYRGDDARLDLEVLDADDVPVDLSGMAITCYVGTSDRTDSAFFSKACSIVGTYNADRDTNTQRARASLSDDETILFDANPKTGYRHSFKRTDAGSETVLARGPFVVLEANAA